MDPHSFIARAEAQRWLGIAEKLLMGRDLVGSKTFAIRAREADPRLEPAEQILAIADTLLAAEKRVGNNNNQPDWYSILQLVRLTHDSELIASQFRRLALLLNPNKTQLPYADQAFQLVSDAWSVLSNPMRKSIYDSELNFPQQFNPIGFTREVPQPQQHHHQQPQQQQHHQQQQQHNFFSPPSVVGSGREQERPERPFVIRPQQQHNFLSQPNLVGLGHEPEQPVRPSFQSKPTQQQQQPPPQQQRQPPQVQQRPPPPSQPQQPQPQPQPQPQIQSNPPPPPPPAPPQPQPQPQQPPPPQQQSQERNAHAPAPRETSNGVREEREMDGRGNVDGSSKFWTACPFCFNMYEYFRVYVECTLRCQNCNRAFQAVAVQSPPLVSEGKEAYYYCWGFFPFGISMASLEKNKGKGSTWTPFSPMVAAPKVVGFQENVKPQRNYYKGPRVYIDDEVDDVFVGASEPSDDSDIEWGSTRKKKKAKKVKGTKRKGFKKFMRSTAAKAAEGVNMVNCENLADGFPVQEEGVVVPNVPVAETSKRAETSKKAEATKKSVGAVPRRQSGRVAKELGKLDLNVEFNNNDGEEPAPGMTAGNRGGHREEDNIEGIGFFEGLDEFLSSLPILSVVGDDKVKAT